jgi:hypothetical protein
MATLADDRRSQTTDARRTKNEGDDDDDDEDEDSSVRKEKSKIRRDFHLPKIKKKNC